MNKYHLYVILFAFLGCFLSSCITKKEQKQTPWGTQIDEGEKAADGESFSLEDIVTGGELIVLTISDPQIYYDYHGRGMGVQYLLCDNFAEELGVKLRVELCRDTAEMLSRLSNGEGDIVCTPLPKGYKDVLYCGARDSVSGAQWVVSADNKALADTLSRWFKPEMVAEAHQQEDFVLSTRSITRHTYSYMMNRSGGVISHYDGLFKRYASVAGWDWHLLAAQCYQESCFDPQAHSWAGACGLMQIMPSTADHLSLPRNMIYDPEQNIAAAARYIRELTVAFRDVNNPSERVKYVLASYNGGSFHVRDAMALASKDGKNQYLWSNVEEYILQLSNPRFYRDPVVKNGYMRGSETYNYVRQIMNRWDDYRGVKGGTSIGNGTIETVSPGGRIPQKATKVRKAKYDLEQ